VLAFAKEHEGDLEACVAKPGVILPSSWAAMVAQVLLLPISLPAVERSHVVSTLLHQAVHGFEKEPLLNTDLVRIGRQAQAQAQAQVEAEAGKEDSK
jgi:hypothetical protein